MSIACVEKVLIVDDPKQLKDNAVVANGNGEKINGESKVSENGHKDENGKDWRSIEENGEVTENGTFEKSWSTKYRTDRNQFDNSSL